MNTLIKLYHLHQLLVFGEKFTHDISTISKPQIRKESLGQNPSNALIGLITKSPLLDSQGQFLPKKSAEILQKMIENVFQLSKEKCSILSLLKTESIVDETTSENMQYRQLLLAQIMQSPAKVFVIFDTQIAMILFDEEIKHGTPFKFAQKTFITTHSLTALIKLPALKRETLNDLKTAKALL